MRPADDRKRSPRPLGLRSRHRAFPDAETCPPRTKTDMPTRGQMNSRELVELAALVVSQAGDLLRADQPLDERVLQAYWSASKCRQQCWHAAFKRYHQLTGASASGDLTDAWRNIRATIDEILGSEVLARVWAAVLCEFDQRRGVVDAGPIVRNVLVGHLEARHRALNVMVFGRGASIAESVQLNRIRRRYEEWNDLLLGALQAHCQVRDFAVEPPRVQRFAADLAFQGGDIALAPAWRWILATMRSSFMEQVVTRSPNPELNAQIAASVLALLGRSPFELTDVVRSPWLRRFEYVSNDTFGDVAEQLFRAYSNRGKDLDRTRLLSAGDEAIRGGEFRYWR